MYRKRSNQAAMAWKEGLKFFYSSNSTVLLFEVDDKIFDHLSEKFD